MALSWRCVAWQMLGHEAFGGSVVLLHPASHTALAVTVNHLTLDKAAPRQVLRLLARELGLPLPPFVQGGMFAS